MTVLSIKWLLQCLTYSKIATNTDFYYYYPFLPGIPISLHIFNVTFLCGVLFCTSLSIWNPTILRSLMSNVTFVKFRNQMNFLFCHHCFLYFNFLVLMFVYILYFLLDFKLGDSKDSVIVLSVASGTVHVTVASYLLDVWINCSSTLLVFIKYLI